MSHPLVLIHLVSDQTMQNIMPILALRSGKVIQIVSQADNPRYMEAARRTRQTVNLAMDTVRDFRFDCEWPRPVDLGSQSPTLSATLSAVEACLNEHPEAVVNYTGGTKNMSIGAWAAAQACNARVLYCDTPMGFVVDDQSGSLAEIPNLNEVAAKLTVPIILQSQGLVKNVHWISKQVGDKQKSFGQVAFDLIREYGDDFRSYRHQLFEHGSPANGKIKLSQIDQVISNPVPGPNKEAFHGFLKSAVDAGLLRVHGDMYYYNVSQVPGCPREKIKLQIERIAQGLTGAAFEGYVANVLSRSTRFSSFLANIYPSGRRPEEQGFGESDFLAYEPAKISLTLVSCKSSPPGLEHLESLLARKAKFGGLFASTLVCVESCRDANREKVFRSHCSSLGIGCAVGSEIPQALGAIEQQSAQDLLLASFGEPDAE